MLKWFKFEGVEVFNRYKPEFRKETSKGLTMQLFIVLKAVLIVHFTKDQHRTRAKRNHELLQTGMEENRDNVPTQQTTSDRNLRRRTRYA
ncbi:hypothetical protein H5410_059353 [Solanum commersonii]|uniref:Uncharacterized protein n=1 Tax=Solanum commersonii TaxID=4109 RepID=A0A9J5W250_SOLCO|nr:hypothetical protein H5410_059353 [Solanum commersonii]